MNVADLLSHYRQHIKLNSVELIKACPRSRLSKTLEKLGHCMVVHSITTIENNALRTIAYDNKQC